MNRSVYSYLLKTYGRRPGWWIGIVAVIFQTLLLRIVAMIIIARLAADIAAGNFENAKLYVLLYFLASALGLGFRLLKELVAVKAENEMYGELMVEYYRKLVSKDMAFFRDHQTGYLASTFRQHGDSVMELARLIRGELLQTPISLIVPTVVLFAASWKVGLVFAVVIIVQVIYILWSSSTANEHRIRSQEIYRKISGTVSDDVTNIVAHKTSGLAQAALRRLQKLIREEVDAFWQRRKIMAILNTPRELLTITAAAIAFWVIVSNAESTTQSIGLIVLTLGFMVQIFQSVQNVPDLICCCVPRLFFTIR